ncbi:cysteine synthase [Candidatus Kuenenia stuttgartiensis]|jgi:cysteine synthase B|uniref:cysteine synthase n=3 Tax=Candidatus Brocadiaceae TaxID=1127830 RepID=Q1Q5P5_KUEST|nr:cysteine synthase family protein [Candidatus Kuenenia stuttgartiensis]MCL4727524.1 cysteine synthase family protein [Candidatus Kuenenia stuttgartiensis]QII12350.1 cysteine synthase [Candidatus Kuenenia stuttgartiensis]CAJ75328.1 strongly similar to cysteine synthase (O-acetylserine sulfhydrylase) (O-acetylserine (Thiol)-lyase) [Candidatus Kuenenia stuttgartiensis]SOH06273.1 strongly similar to cysteine synthase (O-acetylserine sulfhydrylase) (O-acetylserine (Thiol)-lyase) [Candidatus Kuenen
MQVGILKDNDMPRKVRCNSILERIGNTPLIRINKITKELQKRNVEIYVKAEWFNPGGSVKDRPALRIVEDAEKSGKLGGDKILIDSTSGNTGIAYAFIGAVKGYEVNLVMPLNVSEERKRIVSAFGTKTIYTDPLLGSDGAMNEAKRLVNETPAKYFYGNQYNNPSNWMSHYETTGVEIWKQTEGNLTHFIACLGTSGTLMGTGKRLKKFNSNIQVISVEPDTSIHGLEGMKHMETSITPGIYNEDFPDRKMYVETEDAYKLVKRLAAEEGFFVGYSSGAALAASLKVADEIKNGMIVTIFPDRGDRYLSTSFW